MDDAAADVVQRNGGHHKQHVHRLAPAVEEQADQKQHQIAQLSGGHKVQPQHDGDIEI